MMLALDWLKDNWVELFGSLSGLLYIWFSLRHSIWLWPVGFFSSAAFVLVFYSTSLYADMTLQVYYCVASIYGWLHWKYGKNARQHDVLPIFKLKVYQWLLVIFTIGILTLIYQPIGIYFQASYPIIDGFITAGSIVATYLLARKILDQWLIWIVVDALSVVLLVIKHKYMAAGLMFIYTILAIFGYFKWLHDYKNQSW